MPTCVTKLAWAITEVLVVGPPAVAMLPLKSKLICRVPPPPWGSMMVAESRIEAVVRVEPLRLSNTVPSCCVAWAA